MNIDQVMDALRPHLLPEALHAGAATPFAFELAQGPRLEWRYDLVADALFAVAPLGQALLSTRAETHRFLLQANLFLAELGAPHFAADGQGDTLYLCRTVAGWCGPRPFIAHRQLQAFLESWAVVCESLRAQALVY